MLTYFNGQGWRCQEPPGVQAVDGKYMENVEKCRILYIIPNTMMSIDNCRLTIYDSQRHIKKRADMEYVQQMISCFTFGFSIIMAE